MAHNKLIGTVDAQGTGRLPTHLAIIMDGNRRWAKARHLPAAAGHRAGAKAVQRTVEACADRGIRYLTLYAFSSENWGRPRDEVGELMNLMRHYLRNELERLHENGVRVRMIGERERFDPDILDMIARAEERTRGNLRLDLVVALNYGARAELARAARQLAQRAAAGLIDVAAINEDALASALHTSGLPDPDLLIRTGGERRISNFLLWQMAYTEFLFLDVGWPDFGEKDLELALADYARRERRYGVDAR
ncbi:Undecaprenyl pyrophosphate synthetase [Arboricoccus pini]|uniref:Isoprenyl transferase n=2 Tax=Arboricoccus pini TaxID=1963835 RepID=A0A212R765_9PROT|nr:Undecaprenyl pyrophosphate synthetase [Arboricoccus pini]